MVAADFSLGVSTQMLDNNTAGLVPELKASASESTAMLAGRVVGDVMSISQGAGEMSGGAGMMGGGAGLCLTGFGCLATPVAQAVGATAIAHGAATTGTGIVNLAENANILFSKATSGPSSSISPINNAAGGTGTNYDKMNGQGVYVLKDQNGKVVYVGRGDAPSRLSTHATDPFKGQYEAEIVANNNLTYNQARGLEQLLMDHYGTVGNGVQNINGISVTNQNRGQYLGAASPLLNDAIEKIN